MTFLKSRYYPVDLDRRVILNQPQKREVDCSFPKGSFSGCVGIKGERLNSQPVYQEFVVRDA